MKPAGVACMSTHSLHSSDNNAQLLSTSEHLASLLTPRIQSSGACCRIVEYMIDVNVIVTHNKRVLAWVIIFIPTVTALLLSPETCPGHHNQLADTGHLTTGGLHPAPTPAYML